jgi:hypothetical protein
MTTMQIGSQLLIKQVMMVLGYNWLQDHFFVIFYSDNTTL